MGEPKSIAWEMLNDRGASSEFGCLEALWQRESGWQVTISNRGGSGAYGIPQALPGSKMGPGWQTDARVQISWGVRYVYGRYGGPCAANSFQLANGWY